MSAKYRCDGCFASRHLIFRTTQGRLCSGCVEAAKLLDRQEAEEKCCAVCHQPMPLGRRQWLQEARNGAPFLLCSEACFQRCRSELQRCPMLSVTFETKPEELAFKVTKPPFAEYKGGRDEPLTGAWCLPNAKGERAQSWAVRWQAEPEPRKKAALKVYWEGVAENHTGPYTARGRLVRAAYEAEKTADETVYLICGLRPDDLTLPLLDARLQSLANNIRQSDLVPIESGEGIVLPEQPGDKERFLGMTQVDRDEAAMRDPIIGKRVREMAARRAVGLDKQEEDRRLIGKYGEPLESQPVTEPGDAVFNEAGRRVQAELERAILTGPQRMTAKESMVTVLGLTEAEAEKVLAGTAKWRHRTVGDLSVRPEHAAPINLGLEERATAFEEAWDKLGEGLPKVNEPWTGFTPPEGCELEISGPFLAPGRLSPVEQETEIKLGKIEGTALLIRLLNLREAEYVRCEFGPFLVRCGQSVWDHLDDDYTTVSGQAIQTIRERMLQVEGVGEVLLDNSMPPTGMALQPVKQPVASPSQWDVPKMTRNYGDVIRRKLAADPVLAAAVEQETKLAMQQMRDSTPLSQEEDGCRPDAVVEEQP